MAKLRRMSGPSPVPVTGSRVSDTSIHIIKAEFASLSQQAFIIRVVSQDVYIYYGHNILAGSVGALHLILFGLAFPPLGVGLKEHIEQRGDSRIWLACPHSSATCWASIGVRSNGSCRLPLEPFLYTRAAERV